MSEDLPSPQGSRRAAARERLEAHRRRARVIRRRVAGMSLATILAGSGAVLVQLVTGHDPALGHGTRTARTSRAASPSSSAEPDSTGSSSSSSRTSGSVASAPSAVTTHAS